MSPTKTPLYAPRNSQLAMEHVAIGLIRAAENNPRHHPTSQIKAIVSSISAFGFNVPLLIDSENQLIAGHARLLAAQRLGMTEVPVIRLDHLKPAQAKAFMLADNKLAEAAKWDKALLGQIFLDLGKMDLDFDIEDTGFSVAEIDLTLKLVDDEQDAAEAEDILPPSGPAVTQPGDIWRLGTHRLMCGSALETPNWAALLGDVGAALVVTDPPYNVPIQGHVSGLGKHHHREFAMALGEMNEAAFIDFLTQAMTLARDYSIPGSVHYWAMDWRHMYELTVASRAVYDRHLNTCVWAKTAAGMGSFYRSQHEFFGVFTHGDVPYRNNVQLGRFGRSRSNVWTYPGANSFGRNNDEGNALEWHPTVKPLALIGDVLLDASKRGDVIVDPFLGSGTTIIAAEKLGRIGYGFELDPLYCDTIIRRWQKWAGEAAVRESDAMLFSALEASIGGDA